LILLAAACELIAQVHLPGTGGHKTEGSSGGASDASKATDANANAEASKSPEQPKSVVSGASTKPDGYVLELDWAPASRTRFVVTGLDPLLPDGSIPESCGKPKKLPGNVTKLAAPYMRTPADAQREWNAHGVCSELDPANYFTLMIQARVAVQLPVQLTSLEGDATASGEQIESYFAGANTTFPAKAFQARCASGAFEGVRVCFDRSLSPRECGGAVNGCAASARITSRSGRP
jgi:ribonuclease T2